MKASSGIVGGRGVDIRSFLGPKWNELGQSLRAKGVVAHWISALGTAIDKDRSNPSAIYSASKSSAQPEKKKDGDAVVVCDTQYERAQFYQNQYVCAIPREEGRSDCITYSDRQAVQRLLELVPDKCSAIDFGCGTALNLGWLLPKASRLYGIDLNCDAVEKARANLDAAIGPKTKNGNCEVHVCVRNGSVTEPVSPDLSSTMDAAMCMATLQHIDPEEDVDQLLANIAAALKPSGVALMNWKSLPTEKGLIDLGLSDWIPFTFTVEKALGDAKYNQASYIGTFNDESAPEAMDSALKAIKQRLAEHGGSCAPVQAVMYDADYCPDLNHEGKGIPGDHNRCFWFYTLEDVCSRAATFNLELVERRCLLDAKRPYGAFQNEVIFRKETA